MLAKELSGKIQKFIKKYGKRSAEDESEWSSPDAALMEMAAKELEAHGYVSSDPWSSWGSGGYGPYSSSEGRKEHDELLEEISKHLKRK